MKKTKEGIIHLTVALCIMMLCVAAMAATAYAANYEGHAAGVNSKYTNAKAIKISAEKTTLAVGEKIKAKVSVVAEDKEKKLLGHTKTVRFATGNPYVAKVSSSGRITGFGKGSCYIYAYAENGRAARVKVTIK
jgi:methionine-rich copper-binding protein CopC